MTVKVGVSKYTIPTTAVRECFRPREKDLITDPDGNEMILIRGQCYPIIRIYKKFKIETDIVSCTEGILIMTECERMRYCVFADELLGEQQVVVKALPAWINKKISGISGCTLLGDGGISLILDMNSLINS
jgi:two-component system chemotaxis sensor kinase CheA